MRVERGSRCEHWGRVGCVWVREHPGMSVGEGDVRVSRLGVRVCVYRESQPLTFLLDI